MAAAICSQYYKYAADQLGKGYVYAREVGNVAYKQAREAGGRALAQAYKYVTVETPDRSRDYYVPRGLDQVVKLTGQAKEWGIQAQALESEKTRWKNVCMVATLGLGNVLYHKGWWDHALHLSALALPLVYAGVIKAPKMIDQYYDAQIQGLNAQIAGATQNAPTVPRASVESKKAQ